MKRYFIWATLITATITLPVGWFLGWRFGLPLDNQTTTLLTPRQIEEEVEELPLNKYTIEELATYPYQPSTLTVVTELESTDEFTSHQFSYQTLDKNMTGRINIPNSLEPTAGFPVILMIRGWAPPESYVSGVGTQPAGAKLAAAGYVTISPDFFGYGDSDPEPEDPWEARFQKPINVIELLQTVENTAGVSVNSELIQLNPNRIGFWAHSNGGQIALSVLEILQQPYPTTLWAPVTAPFPYSILFFTDENPDEGKESRAWLGQFEKKYDVFDFSITQHLDRLTGSIQIHQGTADDAVPVAWNREFVEKIELENERREQILTEITARSATMSAAEISTASAQLIEPLAPINLTYYQYTGSNHNLQPAWDTVVERDLEFFAEEL